MKKEEKMIKSLNMPRTGFETHLVNAFLISYYGHAGKRINAPTQLKLTPGAEGREY